MLLRAYRFERLRRYCSALACKLEGGSLYSLTMREILLRYHGVRVGAYSYGECMIPGSFPAGVTVGRYVSVGPAVRVFLRNHPLDRLSMHPFFYNSQLDFLTEDSIPTGSLEIGHDAWIGACAIITAGCSRIGIGAVVGAGAVVTKDVSDFAIVGGNPARLIRFRFPDHLQEVILASRWWERSVKECVAAMPGMIKALPADPSTHPFLRASMKNCISNNADSCVL